MSSGIQIFINEDGNKIDLAKKLLSGIPKGAQKAVGSALKRTITAAKAQASKSLTHEYAVKAGDLKANLKGKPISRSDGGIDILFTGSTIPLSKYQYKVSGDGRVSARAMKSSGYVTLKRAFVTNVGGHTGIFERNAQPRTPIQQFIGPSPPYMLSANEKVQQEIDEKIRETFDKRIDHEIQALLNGWR